MVKRLASFVVLVMLASCGGERGAVTVGPPRSVEPGGWVAFDRGAFSVDGGIAFIGVDGDGNPRVGRSVGGKPKGVSPAGVEPTDFAWMPNGNSLLISERSTDGGGDRLVIYNLAGERLRVIPADLRFQAGQGMIVRRDAKVAIVAVQEPSNDDEPTDLVEIDLATGDDRNLTSTPDLAEHSPAYVDDGVLVFAAGNIISLTQGPNGWIGVLDVSTGETRRLTPGDQAVESGTVVAGGQGVAYVAFPPQFREQQALWFVPIGGGEPTKQFALGGLRPSSLTNSNTILYAKTGSPGRPGELVVRELTPPT